MDTSPVRDITQFQKDDEASKNSLSLLDAIFESVHNGILVVSDQGTIIKANSRFAKMWKIPGDILDTKDDKTLLDYMLVQLADPKQFITTVSKLYKKPYVESIDLIYLKDGRIFKRISKPLIVGGKPKGKVWSFLDITDRKQAEDALTKNYDLLSNLARLVPGVMYQYRLYPDGRSAFPYSSPGINDIYEVTPEEVREDATPVFSRLHPDDYNRFSESIHESARTLQTFFCEYRVILPRQGLRWRFSQAQPERTEDGGTLWHGIISDITDRKQADRQLQLLSRAIEQSPVSVVITKKDGNIEYTNPKFSELTGYTLEDVKGKNSRILQSGLKSKVFYENLWNTILSGNDWYGEFHNKKKNGEFYWESAVISSILNSQGNISFFIAVKEDITEKKKMEEDLILAKEKAEEGDRLKSAFLANMSHEIRTPMNGILGFTELLKEPELTDEQQKEYISIIEKSGARMLNIINNIVDISKIESQQMKVSISETNINEQIEFIYNFFRPEVEEKGMVLSFKHFLSAKESIIKTDREKLYGILINLVKNAIKFTKTGSIEFGYYIRHVEPKKANRSGAVDAVGDFVEPLVLIEPVVPVELLFFVKDTGIGIRPEQIEIIFERFRQGSDLLTRNYEGAGLGLSISKAFVEMLGGEIWVESEEGKGSTFYFTIPYKTS